MLCGNEELLALMPAHAAQQIAAIADVQPCRQDDLLAIACRSKERLPMNARAGDSFSGSHEGLKKQGSYTCPPINTACTGKLPALCAAARDNTHHWQVVVLMHAVSAPDRQAGQTCRVCKNAPLL